MLRCLRANACRGMDYMMMMLPRDTPLTELLLSGAAGAPPWDPGSVSSAGRRVQAARRMMETC